MSYRWYDAHRAGLGDEFAESLEHVIELVSNLPSAFPEVAGEIRRALLGRFPYALYYRLGSDRVDVMPVCTRGGRRAVGGAGGRSNKRLLLSGEAVGPVAFALQLTLRVGMLLRQQSSEPLGSIF